MAALLAATRRLAKKRLEVAPGVAPAIPQVTEHPNQALGGSDRITAGTVASVILDPVPAGDIIERPTRKLR